jgi:hypothetical protein
MSDKTIQYGAVGEEGCEFMANTQKEVQEWIDTEIGNSDEPVDPDYYSIYPYTQNELDEMVEV